MFFAGQRRPSNAPTISAAVQLWEFDKHHLLGNSFGSRQVTFHQHRRHRQNVADVVEPVADVVCRKVVGHAGFESVEQIANRGIVFGPVETPHGHAARVGLGVAVVVVKNRADRPDEGCGLGLGGLKLVVRRHRFPFDHVEQVFPRLSLAQQMIQRAPPPKASVPPWEFRPRGIRRSTCLSRRGSAATGPTSHPRHVWRRPIARAPRRKRPSQRSSASGGG